MQIQTADQVWARIAERVSPGEAPGVVASDGDGTLWSGDVGEDLFQALAERGTFQEPGLEAMRREARDHALSDAGTGSEVARRIYAAYVEGQFPEETVCELMAWCFAGWTRAEVASFAEETVTRIGLGRRLHREVLVVLDHARRAGLEAVLVSASPYAVVKAAGALAGFDEAHIVAARPRFEGEIMLAGVERPIPYGAGKVSRLREHIGQDRTLLAAFGDNAFDVDLLASAEVGVAVCPKPRLREHAAHVPGLVELLVQGRREGP